MKRDEEQTHIQSTMVNRINICQDHLDQHQHQQSTSTSTSATDEASLLRLHSRWIEGSVKSDEERERDHFIFSSALFPFPTEQKQNIGQVKKMKKNNSSMINSSFRLSSLLCFSSPSPSPSSSSSSSSSRCQLSLAFRRGSKKKKRARKNPLCSFFDTDGELFLPVEQISLSLSLSLPGRDKAR